MYLMDIEKRLDKYKLIAALITDVYSSYGSVINTRTRRLTLQKVIRRTETEGIGFLTKTLPRLGKALDKALSEELPLNCVELGFKPQPGTKLPKLFGELFNRVLHQDGTILPDPCVNSIKHLRQLLYLYYKYELPYSDEQEQQVLSKFERTEQELETISARLRQLGDDVAEYTTSTRRSPYRQIDARAKDQKEVVREARILLSRLLAFFDPKDIFPRHGPGAVATKQQLAGKYVWNNISAKITRVYPLDEFFFASLGHVCDRLEDLTSLKHEDLPARVCLVPKDSRGPRLISCEPVDYQWVQQGLGNALVRLTETHELTKFNVFFTDQVPNQIAALFGSETKRYATLDLNEASDRVSLELVRLLFPSHVYTYLESCRSSSTVMPDGLVLPLQKFAPMGSCLCFPIMALTLWAILTAAAPDTDTRESIHVYGDDVIVPTAYAENAMNQLESFGLKVNHDKSCTKGRFRESCGMDAFNGIPVTPVRLRTVWSESPSPDVYTSWIAYANSFYDRQYFTVYEEIVEALFRVYREIPMKVKGRKHDPYPSLVEVPEKHLPRTSRWNKHLQRREFKVWVVKASSTDIEIDGWSMLLRYFAEAVGSQNRELEIKRDQAISSSDRSTREYEDWRYYNPESAFSVRSYTRRDTSMLVKRWR